MISNIKYPGAIAKHTLFKDKSDILVLPKKETKLISGSSDLREQYSNKTRIYLFNAYYGNTRTMCQVCSKLTLLLTMNTFLCFIC